MKKKERLKVFRLGELFCGPGGLGYAAIHARISDPEYRIIHQWANDIDEDTCKTYRRNICPETPDSVICADVRELDINRLGEIDAFAFGFPCNDYSTVGEQRGLEGHYGALYTYGVKVLQKYQPQWFLAENVSGLTSANEQRAFQIILRDLAAAGYRIYPHLYCFEQYGVPQARHRVIIVGIRNDLPYVFKIPSTVPYSDIDVSCQSAIEKPPIPENAPNHEKTRPSELVVKRLAFIIPGENAWNAPIPEELQIKLKGGAKISQIYKRLEPEKPSYTVTGSGGGGTHMYHWEEDRALTNRERARLQTFPDDFVFEGSKESVRKQIGMAVPISGAKVIFEAILKTFAGEDYPATESQYPTKYDMEIVDLIDASLAKNTKEQYQARFKEFSAWAMENDLVSLPASEDTVAKYLAYLSEKNTAYSSVTQICAAIKLIHNGTEKKNPIDSPFIKQILKGYRRKHGTAPKKKVAATLDIVMSMIDALAMKHEKGELDILQYRRNICLIMIGFCGAFRRTELRELDYDDLKWAIDKNGQEVLLITVKKSKTDQEGKGMTKVIFPSANAKYDPLKMLKDWLRISGVDNGPLFRPIRRGGHVQRGRLTNMSVAEIIKKAALDAGITSDISGHSLRSGFVTTAIRQGKSERSIMNQTGHKSVEVLREYFQRENAIEDNAAENLIT